MTEPYWLVRIVQLSPTANVGSCRTKRREDQIADLDFGVYQGHGRHGSRSIITITADS